MQVGSDVTPSPELLNLLQEVSERLRTGSGTIARRWHDELARRLDRPVRGVLPGDNPLVGGPDVVRWLADAVEHGHPLEPGSADVLHGIAGHWQRAGHRIEDALLHVRVLSDILLDALRDAVRHLGSGFGPVVGIEAAHRLCRGVSVVQEATVAAYRDAEEERLGDFGATLAHEVRDHLHAALSGIQVAQLLDRDSDDPEHVRRAEVLERIEHSLKRASEVVTAVQSLSEAAGGEPQVWERRPLDAIVHEALVDVRDDLPAEVRIEVALDMATVRVPAEPVTLILHNLVDNGVKYVDPAEARPWVRIRSERSDEGDLLLHVADNGPGVPEEEQERIFLRFHRGRGVGGDGFGLGLAIVQETARTFGGRVTLESGPGEGSTFTLLVPADQLEE